MLLAVSTGCTAGASGPTIAGECTHLYAPPCTRRCAVSLKPDLFEGLRFDLTKPLNHNFALSHSIFMGNIDVPTANQQAGAGLLGAGHLVLV